MTLQKSDINISKGALNMMLGFFLGIIAIVVVMSIVQVANEFDTNRFAFEDPYTRRKSYMQARHDPYDRRKGYRQVRYDQYGRPTHNGPIIEEVDY